MDNNIINIIVSVGVIPFLVNLLKSFLPNLKRFAPIAAITLAVVYVLVGNLLGLNIDLSTTIEKVLLALGMAGGSVLSYDTLKTTLKNK